MRLIYSKEIDPNREQLAIKKILFRYRCTPVSKELKRYERGSCITRFAGQIDDFSAGLISCKSGAKRANLAPNGVLQFPRKFNPSLKTGFAV